MVNAKTQRPACATRPSRCSSTGTWPRPSCPGWPRALDGVELVGDDATRAVLPEVSPATDEDFATEFLDLKLSVAVVDDLDDAIDHIARYGSGHSEAIVTRDLAAADRFTARSTPPPWWSTPRPASSTARSSASGPRSASPPRSCTPGGRWACGS